MQHQDINYEYDDVTKETINAFEAVKPDIAFIADDDMQAVCEDAEIIIEPEVLTGVVLKKYPVTMYNQYSHVLVYRRDDKLIQTYCADYDGSGYFEAE